MLRPANRNLQWREAKNMSSLSQSPRQDPRFPILRAKAERNWHQWNPKLVSQLQQSDSLNQCLDDAAERALRVLQQAESKNIPANQAEELASEELYLPAPSQSDEESENRSSPA